MATCLSCALRGALGAIAYQKEGRMPLSYVAFLQRIIDSLVVLSPIALVAKVGIFCVPVSGLITVCYHGLLELGKSLLDPFGAKGEYPDQNMRIDVFTKDVNEATVRWMRAGGTRPWDVLGDAALAADQLDGQ